MTTTKKDLVVEILACLGRTLIENYPMRLKLKGDNRPGLLGRMIDDVDLPMI